VARVFSRLQRCPADAAGGPELLTFKKIGIKGLADQQGQPGVIKQILEYARFTT
jgi:hypothetical protein